MVISDEEALHLIGKADIGLLWRIVTNEACWAMLTPPVRAAVIAALNEYLRFDQRQEKIANDNTAKIHHRPTDRR